MNSQGYPKKSERAAVVIPVGRSQMSEHEAISFKRCLEVLGDYDICIVSPHGMSIREYAKHWPVHHYPFDSGFFGSAHNNNRMMLSPGFYETFSCYEYILIYHLDSYVFRNEMDHWCSLGYDYIGSPWVGVNLRDRVVSRQWRHYPTDFRMMHRFTRYKFLNSVGNGGFSLRKTASLARNLKFFSFRASRYKGNEDIFLSHYVAVLNPFFRIPDLRTGLEFSFDMYPRKAFEENGMRLPFGCHAWYKKNYPVYSDNIAFWQDHIPFE